MKDNKLHTKRYFKPVDSNNYVMPLSNHHPRWVQNIPLGQMCRVKRNCSEPENIKDQINFMSNRFKERGYNKEFINHTAEMVQKIPTGTFKGEVEKVRW